MCIGSVHFAIVFRFLLLDSATAAWLVLSSVLFTINLMLKSVETLNAESASLNGLVELAYVFVEFSDN